MQELHDITPKGRERNWAQKKARNLFLADVFDKNLMPGVARKVRSCGSYLEFYKYMDGTRKLKNAYFCKVRLCPLCNWRRSYKIYGQVSKMMTYLQEKHDFRYLFVTLTVRNCVDQELSKTIKKLLYDFQNMMKLESFAFVKGYIRVLEVTYSKQRNDYHPHLHCIFAVNKSYFKSRDYLSQKKLRIIWQDVCGFDYIPQCTIQKVKDKETGEDHGKAINGAVCECTKYTVKETDYLEIYKDKEKTVKDMHRIEVVVDTLYRALSNVKLLGLGGCFKVAKELIGLDDAEDGALWDDDLRTDLKYVIERYEWRAGLNNYILVSEDKSKLIEISCDDDD